MYFNFITEREEQIHSLGLNAPVGLVDLGLIIIIAKGMFGGS